MNYLIISFDKESRSFMLFGENQIGVGSNSLRLNNENSTLVLSGLFFEWLFNPEGQVLGIETRLTTDDMLVKQFPFILDCKGVEANDFLNIWFSDQRGGKSRHLLDWEDYYYSTNYGTLFIVLRTHMLSNEEQESLNVFISTCSPEEEKRGR